MAGAVPSRSRKRDFLALFGAALLPLPWMLAHEFPGLGLQPELVAVLSGLAILGAAFLLSWATELAERDIPQALAILFLALMSVLPEYAVDLHFAWAAGKDPSYAPYAVANMTGANRLLIGIGWASAQAGSKPAASAAMARVAAADTTDFRNDDAEVIMIGPPSLVSRA